MPIDAGQESTYFGRHRSDVLVGKGPSRLGCGRDVALPPRIAVRESDVGAPKRSGGARRDRLRTPKSGVLANIRTMCVLHSCRSGMRRAHQVVHLCPPPRHPHLWPTRRQQRPAPAVGVTHGGKHNRGRRAPGYAPCHRHLPQPLPVIFAVFSGPWTRK